MGSLMVGITRVSEFRDRLRAYKIVLDGVVTSEIRTGQEINFEVSPGKHRLFLKIDWCGSNSIECGNSLQGWRLILGLVYVIFLHNRYLWLKRRE